ncbi:hypothetical protein SAMN05216564_11290 [Halopenitus persicus]|uniref:Uncharacterized protein n=1 Tax=Halopenitus persicus TaxID=1048396 RepID=A0A1H3NEY1_9EURY|nr:hypothetical protein SAMN05216564_11290 [Halopenitus persicus]
MSKPVQQVVAVFEKVIEEKQRECDSDQVERDRPERVDRYVKYDRSELPPGTDEFSEDIDLLPGEFFNLRFDIFDPYLVTPEFFEGLLGTIGDHTDDDD